MEKNGHYPKELREQDRADLERWKAPGGWLWLQDKGFYDNPPDPVLLLELEDGRHDEDLGPEEARELAADLRERLEANPELMEGSDSPGGAKPPF